MIVIDFEKIKTKKKTGFQIYIKALINNSYFMYVFWSLLWEGIGGGILVRSLSIDLKKIQKSVKKRQGEEGKICMDRWYGRGRKIFKKKEKKEKRLIFFE